MAKPNYRHAKKQKEAARKARQDAKQQRRAHPADGTAAPDAPVDAAGASEVPAEAVAPLGTATALAVGAPRADSVKTEA